VPFAATPWTKKPSYYDCVVSGCFGLGAIFFICCDEAY